MKNRKLIKYILYSVAAICIAVSVAGCATLQPGPQFTQLDPIPAGKSVVYFYRPFFLMGSANLPSIHHNGEKVLWGLPSETYWKYYIDPGTHTFQTKALLVKTTSTTIVNKKAGEAYYLKVEYRFGVPFSFDLNLKNEVTAQVEMRDCYYVKE
ncbi:MAG: DUF2846 domain-containing protein [Deltaproteobacteria bacterium]|nr:DUF2846 domain-containing protein [Deltaproteobacteria bacterium]MBW2650020.1 DUF2846 domain-containing protein [Deltaproteobacteria bacterium]